MLFYISHLQNNWNRTQLQVHFQGQRAPQTSAGWEAVIETAGSGLQSATLLFMLTVLKPKRPQLIGRQVSQT